MSPIETDVRAQANQGLRLQPGDTIVLCTDGLTDLVTADEINSALSNFDLSGALQDLVDRANGRGGHDNISIVALQVPRHIRKPPSRAKQRRRKVWIAILILLALFIASFGFYQYWLSVPLSPTPTARPSLAPLVVPTVIPTGTPQQVISTQTSPGGTLTSPNLVASQPVASQSPSQATYTPWPTSTGQAP
jgi:protein phosphatase